MKKRKNSRGLAEDTREERATVLIRCPICGAELDRGLSRHLTKNVACRKKILREGIGADKRLNISYGEVRAAFEGDYETVKHIAGELRQLAKLYRERVELKWGVKEEKMRGIVWIKLYEGLVDYGVALKQFDDFCSHVVSLGLVATTYPISSLKHPPDDTLSSAQSQTALHRSSKIRSAGSSRKKISRSRKVGSSKLLESGVKKDKYRYGSIHSGVSRKISEWGSKRAGSTNWSYKKH
ncbi:MAG: hypothetical protein R3E84_05100 [Pseudomonadales bacterium]